METLTLSLFGSFQATWQDQPLTDFATDKIRALLAYLALEGKRPFRREILAALLWPDWSDTIARRNLRQSLHRLKQTLSKANPDLADVLLSQTRQTVQFHHRHLSLDVAAFQECLAVVETHTHGQLHDCQSCLQQLKTAAALYTGELLAGFSLPDAPAFAEWLLVQRETYHQQILLVLHNLASAYAQQGNYEAVQQYARWQLSLEPWREESHRQLMRALALSGQRGAALNQYEVCRHVLFTELGIDPMPETNDLYAHIRDGRFHTASPVEATLLHHFPTQFTRFVGRQAELKQIISLLADPDCRLLTLHGTGGIGKTRLALEAARHLATVTPSLIDDMYFIPLASLTNVDLLPQTLVQSLDIAAKGITDFRRHLLQHLQSRKLLLVLDNFEHLLEGTPLLLEILQTAPQVKLLVTSRTRLHLSAERLIPLSGLDYPRTIPPDNPLTYSAVQLFVQAATQVRPGFHLTPAAETAVCHICQLVQGMPLAVEMAAAWTRLLDCVSIYQQITVNLDFLTATNRDVPARHHSMRAVFDYSWQQLTPTQQKALAQFAIFPDSFTLDTAQVITGASLPTVADLLDKSLLQLAPGGRYTLHELLRQFAAEKLTSTQMAAIQQQYSLHYLAWVAQQEPKLYQAEAEQALTEMRRDIAHIRQAWQWAVAKGLWTVVAASINSIARVYMQTGWQQERYTLFQAALPYVQMQREKTTPSHLTEVLSYLHLYRATDLLSQGEIPAALAAAQTSVELGTQYGHTRAAGEAHGFIGWLYQTQAEYDTALSHLQQALTILTALNEARLCALMHVRMGTVYWRQEAYELAQVNYEQALQTYTALGYQAGMAHCQSGLALVFTARGLYTQALTAHQQAWDLDASLGNKTGMARHIGNKGTVYHLMGNLEQAETCYQQALQFEQETGFQPSIGIWLGNIGQVYAGRGDHETAVTYYDQAISRLRAVGDRHELASVLIHKADSLRQQGLYAAAHLLNQEGMDMAAAVGHRKAHLRGQVLASRLQEHNIKMKV